jgi:hypothetical protein
MAYRYYISTNNKVDWTEFFPYSKNLVTVEPEANEAFKRPKIDELIIDGRRNPVVYATLETDFDDTSKFGDYVYFKLSRAGTDTFFFLCSINDGKLNRQNKLFSVTPRPDDNYEPILKQYERKFQGRFSDVLQGAYYLPTLDSANAFLNVDFSGFSDIGATVTWSNAGATTQYARKQLGATQPVGSIVYVVIKNLVNTVGGPGSRPQIRMTNSTGATVGSNNVVLTGNGRYVLTSTNATAGYIELRQVGSGGGDNGSFDYEVYRPIAKNAGKPLEAALISFLGVGYLDVGLTPKSTILFNDALPSVKPPNINTYITANPTNDYVVEAPAIWNSIVMANADSLTTAKLDFHEMSFKDICDILKTKLRIFWYIDSAGFVRFEHEKYFNDFDPQIDLTSATYDKYRPEIDRKVYNYEKSNLYSQILYQESNEGSPDWMAFPVEYDLVKTTPKTLTVTPPLFSSDAANMDANPGSSDNSGFMLLQCVVMAGVGPLVELTESPLTAGDYYPNTYLSWSWLVENYYTYFGDADEADINGGTTLTLDGVKRFKKQVGIKFYHDGILDWIRPVTLEGGTGWIEKMEIDLTTGWYTIDVGFDPY